MTSTPQRREPPANVRALQARMRNFADSEGALVGRVQRQVAALVVAEMLRRVQLGIDGPPLLVKGGSALEFRLGLGSSRTSKDLDAVVRGDLDTFIAQAGEVVREPLAGFVGSLKRLQDVEVPGMRVPPRRFQVALAYQGKPFVTVPVEVSPAEGAAAHSFDEVVAPAVGHLGLDDFSAVPCLSIRYQIAQKLHACTDPLSDGRLNTRARDLVDLQLLEPLLGEDALGEVLAACLDVFTVRGRHSWPPVLRVVEGWPALYGAAIEGLDGAVAAGIVAGDVEDAVTRIRGFIGRVQSA